LNLNFNNLKKFISQNGRSYYELRYDIEMVVLGTSGSLEFSVIINDVRQGKKDVKVELR
jgi:dihydroorotase